MKSRPKFLIIILKKTKQIDFIFSKLKTQVGEFYILDINIKENAQVLW